MDASLATSITCSEEKKLDFTVHFTVKKFPSVLLSRLYLIRGLFFFDKTAVADSSSNVKSITKTIFF